MSDMSEYRTTMDDPSSWHKFAAALLESVATAIELQGPETLFDSPGEIDIDARNGKIIGSENAPTGLAFVLRYDYRRQIGGAGSNRTPFWESGELNIRAWLDPESGALKLAVLS